MVWIVEVLRAVQSRSSAGFGGRSDHGAPCSTGLSRIPMFYQYFHISVRLTRLLVLRASYIWAHDCAGAIETRRKPTCTPRADTR